MPRLYLKTNSFIKPKIMTKPFYFFDFRVCRMFWLILLGCLWAAGTQAQNAGSKLITGTVQDRNGESIPGVSVRLKSAASGGTATNQDGKFSIRVTGSNPILVFSSIGYLTKEVTVGTQTVISVHLEGQQTGLTEVVVTGYGSTIRKDVTGSVASVNIADLQRAPVKSLDDALGGRIPGVLVVSPDGQPGSTASITIRGANSLTQDNSPLYVVDGFPVENFDLKTLNPNELEAIDVLKDASATAIYGARGANGVIIITTKRGKAGAPVLNYTSYYGITNDQKRIPVLSPYEFVKLQQEIDPIAAGPAYTTTLGKTLDDYRDVPGIDWYSKVFRTAPQQNHNISLSGGTDKTKYSFSGSIFNQEGIIINSGYRRFQGRMTLDQNVTDKLKVGITTNYTNSFDHGLIVNNSSGSSTFMWTVWGYRPVQTDPAVDIQQLLQDPTIGSVAPARTNPQIQAQNEIRTYTSNNLFSNAYLDYSITKDLRLRITGGVNSLYGERDAFNNSLTRAGSNIPGSVLGINGNESYPQNVSLTNENTLTYTKHLKDHTITALAGYTIQTNKSRSFGAVASNVPNESLGVSGLDEGVPYSISSSTSSWGLTSYLARLNYGYRSKYLVTASIRADGSSKFPKVNRWGYFPSGAVAYRFSEEKPLKKLSWLDDSKLRIGWGMTGNNRVGDFSYLSSLGFINNGYSFGNATPSQGAVANGLGNPQLKWESTAMTNIGVDLSFFKSRLTLTADWYRKVTSDLLLNAALPITTGYQTAFKNVGKVSNSGLEFAINTVNISNKTFQWSSNFNISFNRNKVLALTENQESITSQISGLNMASYIAKIGQPIAMFYGVVSDGVYQYSDFNVSANGTYVLKDGVPSNSTAALRSTIRPGYIKFKDLNGDGVINNYDYTTIGNPNPDFIGGFSNNFRYKNFDLNIFFQFSYGNQVLNGNLLDFQTGRFPYTNQYASFANRWSPTNQNTDIPKALGAVTNFVYSRLIEDGSFLRFKTAQLGYTFEKGLLDKIRIHSLRVYVSGQNLWVWTKYSGMDPEVSVRDSPLTPAYDYSPYPHVRTFVAGVNLTF